MFVRFCGQRHAASHSHIENSKNHEKVILPTHHHTRFAPPKRQRNNFNIAIEIYSRPNLCCYGGFV